MYSGSHSCYGGDGLENKMLYTLIKHFSLCPMNQHITTLSWYIRSLLELVHPFIPNNITEYLHLGII